MPLFTVMIEDDNGNLLQAIQIKINAPLLRILKFKEDGTIIDMGETCHE